MDSSTVSQTTQAAALSALSNIIAQVMAAYNANDPHFTLRLAPLLKYIAYSVLTTPPNIYWQAWLERQFPGSPSPPPAKKDAKSTSGTSSTANLVAKFALDQTVGAAFNILLFIGLMGLLDGSSPAEIRQSVGRDAWKIYLSGTVVWPAVSLVSFAAVPVERRVLFGSLAGVAWGVYLSLVAIEG